MVHEVEPIRNVKDINKIKQYLLGKKNKRDYCIFVVGINVGLRAGDLLSLKISDVTDGKTGNVNKCAVEIYPKFLKLL